jgi:hypothetical protein
MVKVRRVIKRNRTWKKKRRTSSYPRLNTQLHVMQTLLHLSAMTLSLNSWIRSMVLARLIERRQST